MTRRSLLASCAGLLAAALAPRSWAIAAEKFEVTHTDEEWHKLLSPDQFAVLRKAATERPFSSKLLHEEHKGVFACAGCDLDLFQSNTKFDSGTGWPSFWKPLPNTVLTKEDRSIGMTRTEVLCSKCGGHLGHVFDDGPRPTGLRYCMNGGAMVFHQGAV